MAITNGEMLFSGAEAAPIGPNEEERQIAFAAIKRCLEAGYNPQAADLYEKDDSREADLLIGQMVITHKDNAYVINGLDHYKTKPRGHGKDGDPLGQYLQDIGQYRLLSQAEEISLARKLKEAVDAQREINAGLSDGPYQDLLLQQILNGVIARQAMFACNLRLVVHNAKKLPDSPEYPMLDRIQEGNMGLEKAISRFNTEKGFRFSTYATWWIKQSLHRGRYAHALIRLPYQNFDKMTQVRETYSLLENQLQRQPTGDEIKARLDFAVDNDMLITLINYGRGLKSLDAPIDDDDSSGSLGDIYHDPDKQTFDSEELEKFHNSMELKSIMDVAGLSTLERLVLTLRTGPILIEPEEKEFAFGKQMRPMPNFADVVAATASTRNSVVSYGNISELIGVRVKVVQMIETQAMKKLRTAAGQSSPN